MSSRPLAMILVVLVACSHRKPAPATTGSGSASFDDPAEAWSVVRMTADTVIVTRGTKVAVLDPVHGVISHPAVTPWSAEHRPMYGRLLTWVDGANDDNLHLVDLTTGKERWHVTLSHRGDSVLCGEKSIAAMTVEGVELRHLADGSLGYHRPGPRIVDSRYEDGTFVFIDDTGHVEAVDDAGDAQRWTFDDPKPRRLPDGDYLSIDHGVLSVFDARLDLATGNRRPIVASKPRPHVDTARTDEIAYASGGGRLVAELLGSPRKMYMVVGGGEIVWGSREWDQFLLEGRAPDGPTRAITSAESGAVILQTPPTSRILVGFDNKTGHVRYSRTVGEHDQLLGGDDACIGLLDRGKTPKLECVDEITGAVRWQHTLVGRVRAWHINRHWIVASGSPATLEALDNAGAVLWTTQLPDTQVDDTSKTGLFAHDQMWELGPSYFVLPGTRDVSLVDLATGKLVTVTP